MNQKIVKGITLLVFSTLIIGFVSYKSGYFNKHKASDNFNTELTALNSKNDTIQPIDSVAKRFDMLSSSKSFILREHTRLKIDSNITKIDLDLNSDNMMFSSKSGIIINPKDLINVDSISLDTLKKQ